MKQPTPLRLFLSLGLVLGGPVYALTKPIPSATAEQIAREWVGVYAGGLWNVTFRHDGTGTCTFRTPAESFHRPNQQFRIYSWKADEGQVRFVCRGIEGTAGRWLFEASFLPGQGTVTDLEADRKFELIPVEVLKRAPE